MENKLFKKLFFTIAGWSLISGIIGGLLSFLFVNRYSTERDKANIRYFEQSIINLKSQTDLIKQQATRLEDNSGAILTQLKIRESQVLINEKLRADNLITNDLLEELIPVVQIQCSKSYPTNNGHVLIFNYENRGKYSVIIEKPQIILSTSKIESNSSIIKNKLVFNKDYLLNYSEFGMCRKNERNESGIGFEFNNENLPEILYYQITFKMRTNDEVVNELRKSIKGISKAKINDKSTFTSCVRGEMKRKFLTN